MGLDAYIYRKEKEGNDTELYYWRKNYALNEWASRYFCPDDMADFNCEELFLDEEVVDNLIKEIIFNIDKACDDSEDRELYQLSVLEAFRDIKNRLENNENIFYYAWW